MIDKITEIFEFIWGMPLTVFIVAAGVYLSYCAGFTQVKIKKVLKNTVGQIKGKASKSYRTFMTVLGGTIGVGNVAGVATAIAAGGPGAIFWMWVIAFFSMATKMVEVTLATKHRQKDSEGNNVGGAMYYIKTIKGNAGKILAGVYSVALLLYVLCDSGFAQINTIASSLNETFNVGLIVIAIALIVISIFLVSGGLKRISDMLVKTVPFMYAFYIVFAIIVILANIKGIPAGLANVFKYAFRPAPVIGGFAGATVMAAIAKGSARGIFANEAGLGTSTTVHVTSDNTPLVQGLWGVLEVSIVSFVVCTITGLLILSTGVWTSGLDGAPLVLEAFNVQFGSWAKYVTCIVICLFAYTSYIGFYYEFTTCMRYMASEKALKYLKWIYILPIPLATFLSVETVWSFFADASVGFIAIPNIVALLILSKEFKNIYKKESKKLA